jgi:hypothetical protein
MSGHSDSFVEGAKANYRRIRCVYVVGEERNKLRQYLGFIASRIVYHLSRTFQDTVSPNARSCQSPIQDSVLPWLAHLPEPPYPIGLIPWLRVDVQLVENEDRNVQSGKVSVRVHRGA